MVRKLIYGLAEKTETLVNVMKMFNDASDNWKFCLSKFNATVICLIAPAVNKNHYICLG